jgi:methionyl-tRNA formyltransferase
MKTYLFFAYRDWATNIFRRISEIEENCILLTNPNLCNKADIDDIKPDIIFFYGWSWIVPQSILNEYLCLCLHPSPLPKYRGGSPIQNQIITGEIKSAVTIFRMNRNMDSGDILWQEEMSLEGMLQDIFDRIENIGYNATLHIINEIKRVGEFLGLPQSEESATYFNRRTPEQSELISSDFDTYDAEYFYNMVRCLQPPYPEVFIKCKTGKLIIEKVRYEL